MNTVYYREKSAISDAAVVLWLHVPSLNRRGQQKAILDQSLHNINSYLGTICVLTVLFACLHLLLTGGLIASSLNSNAILQTVTKLQLMYNNQIYNLCTETTWVMDILRKRSWKMINRESGLKQSVSHSLSHIKDSDALL